MGVGAWVKCRSKVPLLRRVGRAGAGMAALERSAGLCVGGNRIAHKRSKKGAGVPGRVVQVCQNRPLPRPCRALPTGQRGKGVS